MSIFGSLFTAVSGLSAQSDSIGMISNNIANVSTIGYKRIDAAFSSLVTTSSNVGSYTPGSVRSAQVATVNQQGILQQSSSPTDIAISGNGFFVVKSSTTDALAAPYFTRAGSFSADSNGNLKNTAGFYLYGWPLDANGSPPAGQENISSLVPVNVAFLGGLTQPTSTASIALNLDSSEPNSAYPVAEGTAVDYATAVQVYDSLGTGHNLTVNFTKMETPTASVKGIMDLSAVSGKIAGQVGNINSTDSFSITTAGSAATTTTITLDGTVSQLLAQINGITDPISGDRLLYAQLTPGGTLQISARKLTDTFSLADVSGTPLAATNLGISGQLQARAVGNIDVSGFSTTDLTANGFNAGDSFDISFDGGMTVAGSVVINAGMTDLLDQLNAIPGVTAAIDNETGFLDIRGTGPLTLTNTSGTPIENLGIDSSLSPYVVTGDVYTPAEHPELLTALDPAAPPSTNGWWKVSFTTPDGATVGEGSINFFGNGLLNGVKDVNQKILTSLPNIDWGNGSNPQDIDFDLAGFTEFASDYNVVTSIQNGAPLGLQTGVSVDGDGFVVAQFSNGQSQRIYQLPVATFSNPNGLNSATGNVYSQTDGSGTYNLREANTGGAGIIASGTLEASNVDLATEFARMIVTQQAYAANSKVITAANQMTQDLLQIQA